MRIFLSLNLLGDASILSLGYDRIFTTKTNFITTKVGLGFNQTFCFSLFGGCPASITIMTLPHHVTFNVGKTKHFFEAGIGGSWMIGELNQKYLLYPMVGYRLQPIKPKKVNFRLYAGLPFSGRITDDILWTFVGISAGKVF